MPPVVLLAGGLATRLRPLTETIPKSLIEINGEPFLGHQLRLLERKGIRKVVLCVGHLGEMVREYAGDGSGFGLAIEYSFDGPVLRGTAGAIQQALPLLEDSFLVMYGDSYLLCDYAAIVEEFERSGKRGLMTVHHNLGKWDRSNVEFKQGRILIYDKKVVTPEMQHIDYGLGVFRRSVFEQLPLGGVQDLADVYQGLLQANQLAAVEIEDRFYEIGSVAGIEELRQLL
jgi:NDP-sugar pyrophosphorylase family protein